MRKIIALIHLSLDGFASGSNDELDWVSYDKELESYAHSMQDRTDAVIWGRRTYEGMASYWTTVPADPNSDAAAREHARFLEESTKIVVSRSLDSIEWPGDGPKVLIKDNIADEINRIKQQPGKDIWFLGSTKLAQTFMQHDLIDEYRFNINPSILGEGKLFFTDVNRKIALKLLEAKTLNSGVILTRYEPVR